MKQSSLLIMFLAFSLISKGLLAQGTSLVVFSGHGEKFTMEINGSMQNDAAAARVEASNFFGPAIKVTIYPDDPALPLVKKTIMNTPNASLFYVYQQDARGRYILEKTSHDWSGEVVAKPQENREEEYASPPSPPPPPGSETSSGKESKPDQAGCIDPMDPVDFQVSRETISHQPFDGPKLSSAKNLAKKNCLMASQVMELIYLFDNESTKLDFAKFAYLHTWDPDNYDEVRDALYTPSQKALDDYIRSVK